MRSNQITNNIFVHVIITRIGHLNFTRNNRNFVVSKKAQNVLLIVYGVYELDLVAAIFFIPFFS